MFFKVDIRRKCMYISNCVWRVRSMRHCVVASLHSSPKYIDIICKSKILFVIRFSCCLLYHERSEEWWAVVRALRAVDAMSHRSIVANRFVYRSIERCDLVRISQDARSHSSLPISNRCGISRFLEQCANRLQILHFMSEQIDSQTTMITKLIRWYDTRCSGWWSSIDSRDNIVTDRQLSIQLNQLIITILC